MDANRRVPINVSVSPSEQYSNNIMSNNINNTQAPRGLIHNGGINSNTSSSMSNTDMREKMNQRMRDFEEESRKWRESFMGGSGGQSGSSQVGGSTPFGSSLADRPRMAFPDFPELGAGFGSSLPLSSLSSRLNNQNSASPVSSSTVNSGSAFPAISNNTHKSFIEEDDNGHKKYKMTFEIGDFKPNEIQVKTEGRQLVVKGDRELVAGSASESKQFNREITVPEFVEPTSISSFLSEGVLTIEAPVILDKLGFGAGNGQQQSVTSSSSSSSTTNNNNQMRNSPFRDSMLNNIAPLSSLQSSTTSSQQQQQQQQQRTAASSSTVSQQQQQSSEAAAAATSASSSSSKTAATGTTTIANGEGGPAASYKFNMSEFRPEDIAITVTDTTLKIHALREESDLRGNGKTYREFKREIGLPQGADVRRLKNSLQPDGMLIIDIPVAAENGTMRPQLSPTCSSSTGAGDISNRLENFSLSNEQQQQQQHQHQQQQQSQQHHQQQQTVSSAHHDQQRSTATGAVETQQLSKGMFENTGKELKLTFDLTGYKPEDLNIKVIDNNVLKVHAVHIDNSRGNQIHREYTRQYILPDSVEPELLRARMSDDGTLTVELPLPQVQQSKSGRSINIQNSQ